MGLKISMGGDAKIFTQDVIRGGLRFHCSKLKTATASVDILRLSSNQNRSSLMTQTPCFSTYLAPGISLPRIKAKRSSAGNREDPISQAQMKPVSLAHATSHSTVNTSAFHAQKVKGS